MNAKNEQKLQYRIDLLEQRLDFNRKIINAQLRTIERVTKQRNAVQQKLLKLTADADQQAAKIDTLIQRYQPRERD